MDNIRNVSVVKDSKGNDIVLINDIQFKGKRKVDWKEVKEYLYGYVGDLRFQSLQMMEELSATICIMHRC